MSISLFTGVTNELKKKDEKYRDEIKVSITEKANSTAVVLFSFKRSTKTTNSFSPSELIREEIES
jgi:hypothetical protein